MGSRLLAVWPLLAGSVLFGCSRRHEEEHGAQSGPAAHFAAQPASAPSAPAPSASSPPRDDEPSEVPPPAPPSVASGSLDGALTTRWKLSAVDDLGPAAPMRAAPEGVFFVSNDDRLLLAARRGDGFTSVDETAAAFAPFGRGPALTKSHAYWIGARGALLRAARRAPALGETVAARGRYGTRVSALTTQGRDVVAYIAGNEEQPEAFVWSEGEPPLAVSENGCTASSVELLAGTPHPRVVVLEGRWGMSPVHLRTLRVAQRQLNLTPDEVIWIGPGSQPLTELSVLDDPSGSATLFLAVSRDPSHFGLSHFSLGSQSAEHAEPRWEMYENGIDPAPVVAERLCSSDYVFFAAPSTKAPRSPQELHAARRLPSGELAEVETLARARAFNDISVAPVPGGVVLAWTADRRTWGLFAGCP